MLQQESANDGVVHACPRNKQTHLQYADTGSFLAHCVGELPQRHSNHGTVTPERLYGQRLLPLLSRERQVLSAVVDVVRL
ncbi:hypothetical protein KOR34_08100 [Posidoniimonas corsicana]|uniref:Uncharacterized protein n=1 Tax=Posidoniimonas corsicana TaxID=1938618 RepID=A0A5C5VD48_9BACT|nr:hypothetical protein KOR34_08100 [Posidoniimonas corsicana]